MKCFIISEPVVGCYRDNLRGVVVVHLWPVFVCLSLCSLARLHDNGYSSRHRASSSRTTVNRYWAESMRWSNTEQRHLVNLNKLASVNISLAVHGDVHRALHYRVLHLVQRGIVTGRPGLGIPNVTTWTWSRLYNLAVTANIISQLCTAVLHNTTVYQAP